jgi:ribosomal protein L15
MRGFTGADPKKRRAEVTLRRLLPLLAEIVGTAQIDRKFLIEKGLLRSCAREFKVIGDVQLPRALSIRANSFSAGARHAIQNAGGEAILLTAAQPEEVKRP